MDRQQALKTPLQKAGELVEPLTRREQEILALLAAGQSNAEIAESLSLALRSVKWYAQQIYTKLGVENRKQAVARSRELGLLETPRSQEASAPGLPSGTVTFLFTDIEGSTPLWEQMPEAMRVAVAQHHAILREAIEANGGQVFQVIGDAFQAAFRLAGEGLCAALAAQRALQAAQWGPTGPLKVRMGLHTGPAELDGGPDAPYQVGHTLNRAARVMSAGYGEQILLSQETADLVERELPQGISLKDLGQHHLKGMQRLEHLYQLVAADLPQHFPPLTTGVTHPHNLPIQLTSFIGREKEVAGIQELFLNRHARLVTLTGSGGTGKTRLALRVAEHLLEQFTQGVWLVELAPLSDPTLVPRAIMEVLGVREEPEKGILQVLIEYLKTSQMLLILDNCEHVVQKAAAVVSQLLHTCPNLRILATSREILGVEGEAPFRCPSLSLPDAKVRQRELMQLSELAQFESVRLFAERAQTIYPAFVLTKANAPVVVHICQRLDGIPLALELAAARTRMLSVEQIAARLDHAFRLLTGGSRSVLPRHQTLKALIDWSYNLLSEEERTLLLRLSVFAGGWTLEAAEQVCSDPPDRPDQEELDGGSRSPRLPEQMEDLLSQEQILDLLGQLIDKSLVQSEQAPAEEPRYRMLETIRQYAHERLAESGAMEKVRERHLDYFLSLALRAEPNLRARKAKGWLDRLDRELDNLRLALEWSLSGSIEKGLRLATALMWFWHIRSHRAEGVEWFDRLLEEQEVQWVGSPPNQAGQVARGKALNALCSLTGRTVSGFGIRRLTKVLSEESRAIFQELGSSYQWDYALALFNLAVTEQDYLVCRDLFRKIEDKFYTAECDLQLFVFALIRNAIEQASVYAEENLKFREEMGDLDGEAMALINLAIAQFYWGNRPKAGELANKCLACFEAVGNREAATFPRGFLILFALTQEDYQQAIQQIEMERSAGRELSSQYLLINALAMEGYLHWMRKEYGTAVQYIEEALGLAREFPLYAKKLASYVQGRVALAQGDYTRSWFCLAGLIPGTKDPANFHYYVTWPPEFLLVQTLGVLAAAQQQMRRAVILFGAQDALCGWVQNILSPAEWNEFEQARATARAALGEEDFTAAWEEGRAMTEDQARRYAREAY